MEKTEFDLYKDIQSRTNGDIYIGVVGPVRTGKSTFINQFMEKCVIPYVEENFAKERMVDELPQSAQGRTIMTTEPKFVPQEAVSVKLKDDTSVRIRLVDCVGFEKYNVSVLHHIFFTFRADKSFFSCSSIASVFY